MENALRACCKGIKIGKILIHREGDNGQQVSNLQGPPESLPSWVIILPFALPVLNWCILLIMMQLIYEKLPLDIAERHVLLLDPILGTG